MKSKETLMVLAGKMQEQLSVPAGTEPAELIERILTLSQIITESGQCLADAGYIRDELIKSEIMKVIREGYADKLSAMAVNKLINAMAKDENYLVTAFDRINSSAVHQLDGIRSVLSYRKTEFQTLSYGK